MTADETEDRIAALEVQLREANAKIETCLSLCLEQQEMLAELLAQRLPETTITPLPFSKLRVWS